MRTPAEGPPARTWGGAGAYIGGAEAYGGPAGPYGGGGANGWRGGVRRLYQTAAAIPPTTSSGQTSGPPPYHQPWPTTDPSATITPMMTSAAITTEPGLDWPSRSSSFWISDSGWPWSGSRSHPAA